MSFPTKKFQTDTPLHLAAEGALGKVIQIFLEHGGNPNTANGRGETCLHSICHRPENARLRLQVMDHLLLWRGMITENGETVESVSINHVDVDGNAAVHYASSNGLLECVERLISLGAIISIVNKAQKTCCELADGDNHKELARMLELALVFQPVDSAMIEFDIEESLYFDNQNRLPMLALDCESFHIQDMTTLIDDMLIDFAEISGESFNRSESLLEAYSWDFNKLKKEFLRYSSNCYKLAQIQSMPVDPYEMDRGPWISESDILKNKSFVENIIVNDNDSDNFGNTKVTSHATINIHKHSEEDSSENVSEDRGGGVIPRGLSVDSILLDFKSHPDNERNIENEKSEIINEMEGTLRRSSSLLHSIDKNQSVSKKKEERKKMTDTKNPIDQQKDDGSTRRNKSEKKSPKSGKYDGKQPTLKHPVFTSNPCSICGDMMQRPVSASNALLTRAAEQRKEKEKMKEKGKVRGNENGGKEKGVTTDGNQFLKDSHINSDIDGTQMPSTASSSTPTISSFQSSSSSSAVYHSTSASTSLPHSNNYSEQQTESQTQTLSQNNHETLSQYEYQSGDVPDLDLRAVQCLSGHSFCLACWSAYVTLQVSTSVQLLYITIGFYKFIILSFPSPSLLYYFSFFRHSFSASFLPKSPCYSLLPYLEWFCYFRCLPILSSLFYLILFLHISDEFL